MANLANCVYRWPLLQGSVFVAFMAFVLILSGQNQVLAQSQSDGCECLQGPKCSSSDDILDPNCQRISRSDCPCCIVCASGEGQPCDGLIRPCDPTLGMFCNRTSNVCEREKVTCRTDHGEYQVDETFNDNNCEKRCTCTQSGNFDCRPLVCPDGLRKKGFLVNDPLCQERPAPDHDNDCCVQVVCASETSKEISSSPTISGTVTKPENTDAKNDNIENNNKNNDDDKDVDHVKSSNLQFLQITPTTVQVQFPDITGGNLKYVQERIFVNAQGQGKDVPWENAIILEGNEIFTLTGLEPRTNYRLRWQTPNAQYPDKEVLTQSLSSKKAPKVIVTGTTFESFTLSFDHFAPQGYEHEYVVLFKPVSTSKWIPKEESVSNKDLPSITIRNLKPNTQYEARIAIYDDYNTRSLGKSTKTISVTTSNGCIHLDQSYGIGLFDQGCEERCQCFPNGTVQCDTRCQPPLHPIGSTAGDKHCVEQKVPGGDECCVRVICAVTDTDDSQEGPCSGVTCGPNAKCRAEVFRGDQAETICVCKDGYTGDPDSREGCYEHIGLPDRVTIRPRDGCVQKNETYLVGTKWNDGCEFTCICSEKLEILCQPRCKQLPEVESEKCELRPDRDDECCKVMYCPDPSAMDDLKPVPEPFEGCVFKNATYEKGHRFYDGCEKQCQCMGFGDMVCLSRCPPTAPAPGQNCYTLPDASDPCCNITVCDDPVLDPDENVDKAEQKQPRIINDGGGIGNGCVYKSKVYEIGEDFYDDCNQFCFCSETGEAICNPIECPSLFGLDVINPFCLEWESNDDFIAQPPMCCPPVPKCKFDGACTYKGIKFQNTDNIPANMSGCEQRCYCEDGEVKCQDACRTLSRDPPGYISCSPEVAIKVPNADRPCCLSWGCPELPEQFKIRDVQTEPENSTTIVLKVQVDPPDVLEGKSGYFKVYFTSGFQGHPDPNEWPHQVIHPDHGLFKSNDNGETRVVLTNLLPSQQYFLRVDLHLQDVRDERVIMSNLISAITLAPDTPAPSPGIELVYTDLKLMVKDIQPTSAFIEWRVFSFNEKPLIDGVQIRLCTPSCAPAGSGGVPRTTPFIHRDTTFYMLSNLDPDSQYEVDVYLIPVPDSKIELISNTTLTFKTLPPVQDPFNFKLKLAMDHVGTYDVDLSWTGVPMPHQQFVNLYRILYHEQNINSVEPELFDIFILAQDIIGHNSDSISKSRIISLSPDTPYQIWLEAYLRNGKVITSNVLDVTTRQGLPNKENKAQSILEYLGQFGLKPSGLTHQNMEEIRNHLQNLNQPNYYMPMIIASVIGGVILLVLIIVGGLYLKRTTTYKAIISGGDRRNQKASFTNRAFKSSSMSIQMSPRKSNGVVELNGSELNRNGTEYNRNELKNNQATSSNGGVGNGDPSSNNSKD